MMGVCAWSLGKEDSLDASLNNARNACSEADALRANPVTAGSLSLGMVSAHCNCKRRCQRRRISGFNDKIPNNHHQGPCAKKMDVAEQDTL